MEMAMNTQDNNSNHPYGDYKPKKFTDEELLEIFPEAKEIIHEKINEYEAERFELISQLKEFHQKIKKIAIAEYKNDFFVWFWNSYIKYFYVPKVIQIDRYLKRLNRQQRLFSNNYSRYNAQVQWDELIERARNQHLSEVALPYLHKARQLGNRISSLCPFHTERTPSFSIFFKTNSFKCFGACGASGDVIAFKMKIDNLSFQDAVKELAK